LIGVGGIFTPEDAWEKIEAGATLLQVYTGLVYEGPAMVGRLVRGLRDRLAQAGGKELADAVGRSAA
jgi:dihydroorotate dehydrogenase